MVNDISENERKRFDYASKITAAWKIDDWALINRLEKQIEQDQVLTTHDKFLLARHIEYYRCK